MDNDSLRSKWNERYSVRSVDEHQALAALTSYRHLFPTHGVALDLACGLGANACVLARAGLSVTAWDLSPVAITQLAAHATREALAIRAEVRDVIAAPPQPDRFDVIVVSHFLHRPLCPSLSAALRPAGVLLYQTFVGSVAGPGPTNPAFRLESGELPRLFADLDTLVYREGDPDGIPGEALYIARKRAS